MAEDWFQEVQRFFAEAQALLPGKNHDYAKPEQDPFLNFRITDVVLHLLYGTPKGTSAFVLLLTKMTRTGCLLPHPDTAQNEALADTLKDKANYSALLSAYLNEDKREPDPELMRILGWQ